MGLFVFTFFVCFLFHRLLFIGCVRLCMFAFIISRRKRRDAAFFLTRKKWNSRTIDWGYRHIQFQMVLFEADHIFEWRERKHLNTHSQRIFSFGQRSSVHTFNRTSLWLKCAINGEELIRTFAGRLRFSPHNILFISKNQRMLLWIKVTEKCNQHTKGKPFANHFISNSAARMHVCVCKCLTLIRFDYMYRFMWFSECF